VNIQVLNVAFEESVDKQAIAEMKNHFALFGDDAQFHEVPDKGIQASILLLTMSSIAIIFGEAFVKKLGDKAAEDVYPIIKSGLSTVYKKYFGSNAQYTTVITASSEKKAQTTKYSLVLSLYCVGKNGEKVKLLYNESWNQDQFDEATDFYLSAITDFVSNSSGKIQNILNQNQCVMPPSLIAWDETSNQLIYIDPIPKSKRI
jgi:hypothetical protein